MCVCDASNNLHYFSVIETLFFILYYLFEFVFTILDNAIYELTLVGGI